MVQSESPAWPVCCAEAGLVEALRERDEVAFADFVVRHGAAMRRVARAILHEMALAEEAVQETWLAVLRGIGTFRQHASLRTWVFRILINRARTIAVREARTVSLPEMGEDSVPAAPGHSPEDELLSDELRSVIEATVASLAPMQRDVITLRDIEGWEAPEVCAMLGIGDVHQRVLLHRARAKVRRALATYLAQG